MAIDKYSENNQENALFFKSKMRFQKELKMNDNPDMFVTHLHIGSASSAAVMQRSVPFLYLADLTIYSTFVLEFLTAHFHSVVCH